jgi:hypothetical protein
LPDLSDQMRTRLSWPAAKTKSWFGSTVTGLIFFKEEKKQLVRKDETSGM